jgi:S1-C subfamily serine protease
MDRTTLRTAGPPVTAQGGLRIIGPVVIAAALLVSACGSAAAPAPSASPSPAPSVSPSPSPSASPMTAVALQNDFVSVVDQVSPSVVIISTKTGLGSGIVFDTQGDILTNNHVVTGSNTFTVTLATGRKLVGTLVGTYPTGDLAVIHVPAAGLQPATFGDSSALAVGDIVLAIGNPLAFQGSVTEGIVSALDRSVAESKAVTLPNVIQTSAEINPGNSGGALINLAGDVVGIPTLAALDPEFNNIPAPGIGFAITSNAAVDVAKQLIANGKVVTPPAANASTAQTP